MEGTDRLLLWSLAAFRTTSFVLATILWLHTRASLSSSLQRLDTLTGFALFAVLWTTTSVASRNGLRQIGASPDAAGTIVMNTIVAGAWNGLYLFGVLAAGFLVVTIVARAGDAAAIVPALAFAVAFGGTLAFTIGGIVGLVYAMLEAWIRVVCRRLLRWASA
jgi:hypothetical protein